MDELVLRNILLSALLMVTSAGIYATLYALGCMLQRQALKRASFVFAAAQVAGAIGMTYPEFLHPFWKGLVLLNAAVYLVLPQGMWWVVTTVHRQRT